MADIRAELTQYPIKTRLSLSGTMIVARDIAHAKILQILKDTGEWPDYFKKYPVYYAGPAKPQTDMHLVHLARRLQAAWTPM